MTANLVKAAMQTPGGIITTTQKVRQGPGEEDQSPETVCLRGHQWSALIHPLSKQLAQIPTETESHIHQGRLGCKHISGCAKAKPAAKTIYYALGDKHDASFL